MKSNFLRTSILSKAVKFRDFMVGRWDVMAVLMLQRKAVFQVCNKFLMMDIHSKTKYEFKLNIFHVIKSSARLMWRTDGDGTVYYYAPYNQAPGLISNYMRLVTSADASAQGNELNIFQCPSPTCQGVR